MRLSGKNFQVWSDFDLDIDGLTILTGPSDTGKSALFRALKGVLRNELPAEWVRDGQDEPMEVEVEAGGYRIAASRSRKGSTKYEVSPGVVDPTDRFAKLDGDVPPAVKGLRYGDVTIGTFDVDPLFGRQNAAQIRDAEERRAALAGMQAEAEAVGASLFEAEKDIRRLEVEAHWLGQASGYRQRIVPLRQIMDALAVPDTAGLDQLHRLSVYAEQGAESSAYARWLSKPLATVSSAMEDWAAVRATWGRIAALEAAVEAGRHVVATDGLRGSLGDAERTYSEAVRLWNSISRLEVLSSLLGE